MYIVSFEHNCFFSERQKKDGGENASSIKFAFVAVLYMVCMYERERERETMLEQQLSCGSLIVLSARFCYHYLLLLVASNK